MVPRSPCSAVPPNFFAGFEFHSIRPIVHGDLRGRLNGPKHDYNQWPGDGAIYLHEVHANNFIAGPTWFPKVHMVSKFVDGGGSVTLPIVSTVTFLQKELVMNASWTTLLAVYMAVFLAAQVGTAAPAAPPGVRPNQMKGKRRQRWCRQRCHYSPAYPCRRATGVPLLCATTVLQRGTVVVATR